MSARWETIPCSGSIKVSILRNPAEGRHVLSDVVRGIEKLYDLKQLCAERGLDEEFIKNTSLLVDNSKEFYMYVDDEEKMLVTCGHHISDSDIRIVYLDFVHELVHIFQLYDGRELFDRKFSYVERPTELEAYELTVREGRKIGMTDGELFEYLKVDWIGERAHRKLARSVGVTF
jgi:hypothetical protein